MASWRPLCRNRTPRGWPRLSHERHLALLSSSWTAEPEPAPLPSPFALSPAIVVTVRRRHGRQAELAAAEVLHASSQEPPLAWPPWPRSRLAPPLFPTTCAANHRRAASAMAGPAELPCRRCSLSYNPPAPAQSSPSEARGTVRPPSPLRRLFRPPECHRRLFRRARAAGHRGQAATSHLRPCRGLPRACASPAQP